MLSSDKKFLPETLRLTVSHLSQWVASAPWPITLLLLVNITVGFITVKNYGESWDEQLRSNYAAKSLKAYTRSVKSLDIDEKGPAFGMIAKIGADAWLRLRKDWVFYDAWHFMNFLSFQLGVWGLYIICRQLLNHWAAIAATLLFSTQPLLWGHAFINPKDSPFMAFFTASVALGLLMVSAYSRGPVPVGSGRYLTGASWREFVPGLRADWRNLRLNGRLPILVLLGLSMFALLIALAAGHDLILQGLGNFIRAVYSADPATILGQLFQKVAQNLVSVDNYIKKGTGFYSRLFGLYALITLGYNLVILPRYFHRTVAWTRDLLSNTTQVMILKRMDQWRRLLAAGIMLGLTISIRVLGPFAGLLVAGYFFYKAGYKAWGWLVVYGLVAAITAYITWPGLWLSPIHNYWQNIRTSADFGFDGQVLFAGTFYNENDLPAAYLPTLMELQFTEPALIFVGIGMAAVLWFVIKRQIDRGLVALLAVWLLLPVTIVIVYHSSLYDNFRHMLVIVPPLFVIAGFGLQEALRRIKSRVLSIVLLLVVILPGVYWIARLYPYEYVYYNRFIGGIPGAYRRFEMDYWATSYREAAKFLNQVAPEGAQVIVWGPVHIVARYCRPDLKIIKFGEAADTEVINPDYAVLISRYNLDLDLYPTAQPVFTVQREGAIFTVVKQLPAAESGK